VQRLQLRNESPPDDAVVVIRGGLMMFDGLRKSAEASRKETGLYLISVFLSHEQNLKAICSRPELRRYKSIRTSHVGELKRTGFLLLATFQNPHYDIALPNLVNETLINLIACFSPATSNPSYVQ
jgi:hypothetical protein